MDWSACAICQKDTGEPLRCPLNKVSGPVADRAEACKTFLENVSGFRCLDRLPRPLVFGEDTTVEDFIQNKAQWHKSCHNDFSTFRLERAQKKRDAEEAGPSHEANKKRHRDSSPMLKNVCIFCTEANEHLHEICTLGVDANIRQKAVELQDTALLARHGNCDLIALEGKYHLSCLTDFRNRHRSYLRQKQRTEDLGTEEGRAKARAFIELVTYMESSIQDGVFFFKLSELRSLYTDRLQSLGVHQIVNHTRFKEMILSHFPGAQEQRKGTNVIIVFEQGMQDILRQAMADNFDEDASVLAKAARIVRDDIFKADGFKCP
eukprot:TRINITY_DN34414_c0_g2_i4.p1 TRINITY_DN34414_c0_g2~~TRINITY_DN34414_c0_g2_i4.p1  ORF type:complete len:320 (+),score=54.44 TRINITY_DN34414_c0_g2_i4:164-1123(+)